MVANFPSRPFDRFFACLAAPNQPTAGTRPTARPGGVGLRTYGIYVLIDGSITKLRISRTRPSPAGRMHAGVGTVFRHRPTDGRRFARNETTYTTENPCGCTCIVCIDLSRMPTDRTDGPGRAAGCSVAAWAWRACIGSEILCGHAEAKPGWDPVRPTGQRTEQNEAPSVLSL